MSVSELEPYAKIIEAMHRVWKPHALQIEPGRDLFYRGKKRIFLKFARQVGKSQFCAFAAVRWALTKPGAQIFIMAPFLTQCRALYLHSNLIKNMVPPEYPCDVHLADGRFIFGNTSQIRLLGGDSYDAARGLTADLFICDEIKDVKEEVWPVVMPMLLARRAPLIVAGTPPGSRDNFYWTMVSEAEASPEWSIYKAKTVDNPYIDKADVERERERYIARGDYNTFLREFEAEYAVDEKRAVFPMFTPETHVKPYAELLREVKYRPSRWQYVCSWDPGHAGTSALLFGAVNNHSGQCFFLDEIYHTDQSLTSVGAIWPIADRKMREIYEADPNDDIQWQVVVDEASVGTRVELLDAFDVYAQPTRKAENRKSNGIGLLKDGFASLKFLVSDRCTHFVSEITGYFLNDKGEFVKANDHAIDASRYLIHAANYTVRPSQPPPDPAEIPLDERPRGFTPDQDYAELTGGADGYLLDMPD